MAGRIREESIAEVREKAPIDEVVSQYVTLKNAGGGSMKGLCPFHDEKTPSFNVNPLAGFYHCFGCGEGGDVIAFLMKIDGLTFTETVERLAEKYGVELKREEGDSCEERPKGPARGKLIEAHRVAQEFYAEQLLTPEAAQARQFLTERGFDGRGGRDVRRWASRRARARTLFKHLRARGFSAEEIVVGGLAAPEPARRVALRPVPRRGCCGRSGRRAARRSGSGRGGSSTTTGSRRSTSTPPRRRSTRRAGCSTASTWPDARWAGRRRRWWSRATPT